MMISLFIEAKYLLPKIMLSLFIPFRDLEENSRPTAVITSPIETLCMEHQ